jgi:hypothetical protein
MAERVAYIRQVEGSTPSARTMVKIRDLAVWIVLWPLIRLVLWLHDDAPLWDYCSGPVWFCRLRDVLNHVDLRHFGYD